MKRLAALVLFLGLFAGAALEAQALQEVLVRARGDSDIWYVDHYGVRHRVLSHDDLHRWFGDQRIRQISRGRLEAIPEGRSLSERTPPSYFDTAHAHHDHEDDDDDDDLNVRVDDSYGRWVAPPHDDGY